MSDITSSLSISDKSLIKVLKNISFPLELSDIFPCVIDELFNKSFKYYRKDDSSKKVLTLVFVNQDIKEIVFVYIPLISNASELLIKQFTFTELLDDKKSKDLVIMQKIVGKKLKVLYAKRPSERQFKLL